MEWEGNEKGGEQCFELENGMLRKRAWSRKRAEAMF